jgi:hypothetical protein
MTSVWLASVVLFVAGESNPSPARLLEEAIAAGKLNSKLAVNWLAQEDIRRYDLRRKRRRTSWVTYEAFKLEGENYYRLVARDGKPLSPKEARAEQLKMEREAALRKAGGHRAATPDRRFSMSIHHILDHHELKLTGNDVSPDGRKIWIIDTKLYFVAPLPDGHSDMALGGDTTLWIDQETKLVLMQELRFTREWENWGPGSLVRYEMVWNGEVMLPHRIVSRVESRLSENEQVYTKYRKFGADATVTFEFSTPPER